jgi:ankyrin repeat protein
MEIALYFAACEGRFSLVKYLIQKGADPNFKFKSYNEDFDTAKHSARSNGHRQVLELLEKEK